MLSKAIPRRRPPVAVGLRGASPVARTETSSRTTGSRIMHPTNGARSWVGQVNSKQIRDRNAGHFRKREPSRVVVLPLTCWLFYSGVVRSGAALTRRVQSNVRAARRRRKGDADGHGASRREAAFGCVTVERRIPMLQPRSVAAPGGLTFLPRTFYTSGSISFSLPLGEGATPFSTFPSRS